MEGMFRCDAFGGQIPVIFETARFRTRIMDAVFGIALGTPSRCNPLADRRPVQAHC